MTVSDTGIGITDDLQTRIFDRFYQADASETRLYEGSGIGLALTKELTDLLGGAIFVDSQEGKGSTFTVENTGLRRARTRERGWTSGPLPWRTPPFTTLQFVAGNIEMGIPGPGLSGKLPLVLVVEDNADLRNYTSLQLGYDFDVLLAEDGKKGLAAGSPERSGPHRHGHHDAGNGRPGNDRCLTERSTDKTISR